LQPRTYTVVERDTLWDIAVRYGLSLEQIIAANPGMTPELLIPGDVLNIPLPSEAGIPLNPPPGMTPQVAEVAPAHSVQVIETAPRQVVVSTTGARLRLRRAPGASAQVLTMLPPATQLTVNARTQDDAWLRVQLPDGETGWVMAQFVSDGSSIAIVPPTPQPVVRQSSGAWQPLLLDGLVRPEPYLRNFTARAIEIYRDGLSKGNNPRAFALVGDSNTATTLFFDAFDRNAYSLGDFAYLEETVQHFKGSFTNNSAAAIIGINTTRMMQTGRGDPARCLPSESPMQCEYRIKRPSVALILLGTNDRTIWQDFEANYRPIIEHTIARGIVPVLLTKGDDIEVDYGAPPDSINDAIRRLSDEYGVPLLDVKQAIAILGLPNNGMQPDGFHYNYPKGGSTTSFTGENLRYGFTIRNLTALQALDAVRRLVMGG
jgi:LysM repeat protein